LTTCFRFGDGYTVTTHLSGDQPDIVPVQQFMAETFGNCELREHHQNTLHYQLPATDVTLAQIFSRMEHTRARFSIEDYAVTQTTLDQVQRVLSCPVEIPNVNTSVLSLVPQLSSSQHNTVRSHSSSASY